MDSHPLSLVVPSILAELKHFDLTGRVVFNEGTVISGGAYGDICKARCDLGEDGEVSVAIKRLRFYLGDDVKMLFEKEIYVWAKLKHPNILPLLGYSFDERTGFPLLVSRLMENGSAWTFVLPHPECDLIHLVSGIARGLAYLHKNGIVHSDIKSDNILITDSKEPVICDFGCSRMLDASRSLANMTTGIKGTQRYLAYELLVNGSKHSKESDVWAFGMTAFELLTRKRPYAGKLDVQVTLAIMNLELPSLPSDMPIPTSTHEGQKIVELWNICQLCWARDPAIRIGMDTIVSRLTAVEHFPVEERGRQVQREILQQQQQATPTHQEQIPHPPRKTQWSGKLRNLLARLSPARRTIIRGAPARFDNWQKQEEEGDDSIHQRPPSLLEHINAATRTTILGAPAWFDNSQEWEDGPATGFNSADPFAQEHDGDNFQRAETPSDAGMATEEQVRPAHARLSFDGAGDGELPLVKGMNIEILDDRDPNWWYARDTSTGREGVVPAAYVM